MSADSSVCAPGSSINRDKYPRRTGGDARQTIPFRFARIAMRHRPSDRLRRVNHTLCEGTLTPLFRVARLAHVERDLSVEAPWP
jgi:hypothetical protein